jgi:hypothetical protein
MAARSSHSQFHNISELSANAAHIFQFAFASCMCQNRSARSIDRFAGGVRGMIILVKNYLQVVFAKATVFQSNLQFSQPSSWNGLFNGQ